MRILFWSGNFWPVIGGAEVLSAKLLPDLGKRGYEFLVVTSQSRSDLPREASYKGIPVYRFSFRGSSSSIDHLMDIRRQVINLKRGFAPDLIHLSAVDLGSFFHLITADAHPAPLLVTLHNFLSTQLVGHSSWLRNLLHSADWITGVSSGVLEEARGMMPEISSRSSVLYNGLDIQVIPEPLPIKAPRLLCLGRLITRKGFDKALSAFASIVERFPHVRLVIAGDGPARPELELQAVELKLREFVQFVGWVEPAKVPALINTATLVIMPSKFEGLPLVALQAALMARPIVGTRAPGVSEVVAADQTGLLVANEDSRALADAVGFLLDHPNTAIRMGQLARRRAQDLFSWERCVNGYDALYRQLFLAFEERKGDAL